jgi:hypothetical protein
MVVWSVRQYHIIQRSNTDVPFSHATVGSNKSFVADQRAHRFGAAKKEFSQHCDAATERGVDYSGRWQRSLFRYGIGMQSRCDVCSG